MITLRLTSHEPSRSADDCELGIQRAVSKERLRDVWCGYRELLHLELDAMIDAMAEKGAFK